MFGMFKKEEPPRELTPEEQAAKEAYDRVWHRGTSEYNRAGSELGYYTVNLDKTFRTFGPELSAKIDAIPEYVDAAQYRAMYDECSAHFNALQNRYNALQREYEQLNREYGKIEGELTAYKSTR